MLQILGPLLCVAMLDAPVDATRPANVELVSPRVGESVQPWRFGCSITPMHVPRPVTTVEISDRRQRIHIPAGNYCDRGPDFQVAFSGDRIVNNFEPPPVGKDYWMMPRPYELHGYFIPSGWAEWADRYMLDEQGPVLSASWVLPFPNPRLRFRHCSSYPVISANDFYYRLGLEWLVQPNGGDAHEVFTVSTVDRWFDPDAAPRKLDCIDAVGHEHP